MSFAGVNIIGTDGTRILTVYSMAGDGKIAYFASTGAGQAQWDAVHDSVVGNAPDYTTANRVNFAGSGLGSAGVFLARGFLPFDTSALPANAVITSASLGLFVTGTSDTLNDGNDFVTLTQGFEASPTSLTVNDYNKAGNATDDPTEGANRIDITNIATNSYIQWNLNTAGLSWITPGGVSQFAVREGHDALDLYAYQTNQADAINAYMSEQPGMSQDPYLQITYTIPNQPPTIASLSGGANPVTLPRSLTLTAMGVSDPDGSVASVAFYRENNNLPGLQTGAGGDAFAGNGAPGLQPGVWSYTADVSNWPAGRVRFYAVATDNLGASSATGAAALSTQTGILPLGDANGDYTVNALDFNILATNFGRSGATWSQGDFNNDGIVNTADFSLLAANFGTTAP
jgi:Dockerin type I domain